MTKLECPNCNTTVLAEDRFCEECGTPLAYSSTESTPAEGCAKCGAPQQAIDVEGYCTQCGFRAETPESKRLEIVINPNFAGASDRGIKHHKNEDYLALARVNNNTKILVVCDGVSSSSQPELASQAAAESTCLALAAAMEIEDNPEAAIDTAFITALTSVSNLAYTVNHHTEPPSTTIIAAVVTENTATIAWLGDSRAYWISPRGSRMLTKDDSWLNEVVAAGEMTEAEAKKSPHAHAITRWLGADVTDSAKPSIVKFTIPGSGYLLLCTDGLWNYAPEAEQLAKLILEKSDTDTISLSYRLVEYAISKGGHDNITVAILKT
jgi:PPM family protein phosphatase